MAIHKKLRTIFAQRQGFTLIELLIVMGVLGGMMTIALFTYPSSQRRSRDTQRLNDLNQYRTALASYSLHNDGLFPIHPIKTKVDALCSEMSTSDCPSDPKSGDGSDYYYQSDNSGTRFIIWTDLEAEDYSWAECSDGNSGVLVSEPVNGNCNISIPEQPTPTPTPIPQPTNTPTPTPTPQPLPTNTPIPQPTNTPTPTPSSTNLIANHSFESGTASWYFYSNSSPSSSFVVENGGAGGTSKTAAVQKAGSGSNIQLYQLNIDLQPNTNYRLSFDAKKTGGSGFSVFIHKHTEPYTPYGLSFSVTPTVNWDTYAVDFTSTSSAQGDARIRFWFSGFGNGRYYIDNITLVQI